MADEITKLTLDITDVLAKLDRYEKRLSEIEKGFVDVSKAGKNASKSFVPESEGPTRQLNDINRLKTEYRTLKTAADTLRGALKTAYDPRAISTYTRELKTAEIGLKKLEQTGAAVGVNLKKIGKEGSLAAQVVSNAFGQITKATIVLGIIDQVVKLTKTAVELSTQFDRAQKSFNAFTGDAAKAGKLVTDLQALANVNVLDADEVFRAGQSLLAFGENADKLPAVLNRIALISKATGKDFSELAVIYGKARTAGVLYAEDINQLVDAGIPIIREFAKQLGVSESQVKKLASEGKISFEELQLAFFNLSKDGSQFSKLAAEQANTLPNLWNATLNKLKPILRGVGDTISGFLKYSLLQANALIDTVTGSAQNKAIEKKFKDTYEILAGTQTLEEANKKALVFAKKKSAEELALEKEAADKRKEGKKLTAAQLEAQQKREIELRLQAMKDGEQKEIAQEVERFRALKKELDKFHISSIDAEQQFNDNVTKIKVKYFLERINEQAAFFELQKNGNRISLKLAQDGIDDQNNAAKQGLEELGGIVNTTEADRRAAINATLQNTFSEQRAFAQAAFQEAELASKQIFYQKKRSDEEIKKYEKDVAKARQIFQLSTQAEELQRTLEFDTTLSSREKATLKLRIQNINTEIAQLQNGVGEKDNTNKKPKSIIELLGFEQGSAEDQAFQLAAQRVKSFIDEITQARIEAADEQRRIADDNVTKAQDALDKELELQKQGFANNVDLRRKDLEDAKKAQDAAIEQQRKAQRQKAVIDSLTQISSLVTAGAQFFSANASIPFVGVALAIAAIATMFSTISRLRASASGATKFRHGISGDGFIDDNTGLVHGRSHSHGGNLIEIEKGELMQVSEDGGKKRVSIVKRENAAQYHDLLDAANRGDRKELARHAFALSGAETPEVNRGFISRNVLSDTVVPGAAGEARESSKTADILQKMLELMIQDSKRERWNADGTVKRKGNVTTYYPNHVRG